MMLASQHCHFWNSKADRYRFVKFFFTLKNLKIVLLWQKTKTKYVKLNIVFFQTIYIKISNTNQTKHWMKNVDDAL